MKSPGIFPRSSKVVQIQTGALGKIMIPLNMKIKSYKSGHGPRYCHQSHLILISKTSGDLTGKFKMRSIVSIHDHILNERLKT